MLLKLISFLLHYLSSFVSVTRFLGAMFASIKIISIFLPHRCCVFLTNNPVSSSVAASFDQQPYFLPLLRLFDQQPYSLTVVASF